MSTPKQSVAYPFRPPAELRERLERSAVANNRSLNAELIARLENSLNGDGYSDIEVENNVMLKAICAKLSVDDQR